LLDKLKSTLNLTTPPPKPNLATNLITIGILIAIGFWINSWWQNVQREAAKESSPQDITCRLIINDGQNAKTQAEYDYAARKFDAQCKGWTDPRQKK